MTTQEPTAVTPPQATTPQAEPLPNAASALIVHHDDQFRLGLEPQNFEQATKIARMVFDAHMFRVKSPEDAMIRIMTGRALGLPMFAALKGLYAVPSDDGNQVGIEAKLKVAMCLQRSDCEYFECIERTKEQSTWVAKRRGRPEKKLTFTYQEAIDAGLVDRGDDEGKKKKNNWNRYRADMLVARASGRLADLVWPEAGLGLPSKEDLEDAEAITTTGETVAETVQPVRQAAPVRDFAAEAVALKNRIDAAKTADESERKAVRVDVAAFKKEAPEAYAKDVTDHYNKTLAAQKPAAQPNSGAPVTDDTLFGPASPTAR